MSLVLEALRRIDKVDTRTGSIGASVASYRPERKPRGNIVPLLLGLLTGGAGVLMIGTQSRNAASVSAESRAEGTAVRPRTTPLKGGAGLPPPLIIEPAARPVDARPPVGAVASSGAGLRLASGGADHPETTPQPAKPGPPLILQAISARDSRPVAIINDQLVREGDRIGLVRVLRIGADSVEVQLQNGKSETVRFPAPPLEPLPSPSPDSRS